MESSAYEAGYAIGSSLVTLIIIGALLGGGVFFVIAVIKAFTRKTPGWIIGAVVAGIVALVGLLGTFGLGAKALSKQVAAGKLKSEKKKRISSPDGRFSVEVPGNWTEMPSLNEAASIATGHALREQYVMVIENSRADFAGNLEDFDKVVTDMIAANLKDGDVSGAEAKNVGTHPALRRRLQGEVDMIRVVYHSASVETPDTFYQILTWTIPSRESAALPVLEEIINSFTAKSSPVVPGSAAAGIPQDTEGKVIAIIVDLLGVNASKVTSDSRFAEDLGADSLDSVELVMAAEEEFGVEIPDENAAAIKTVGDLVKFLDAAGPE